MCAASKLGRNRTEDAKLKITTTTTTTTTTAGINQSYSVLVTNNPDKFP
jgi:hypothetical protein